MKKIKLLTTTVCLLVVGFANSQTYMKLEDEFPVNGHSPSPNFQLINAVSEKKADYINKFLTTESNIEFNYPQGGCPERAQAMHYILDSLNIQHFKVWLFAPSRLVNGSTEKIYINDKNNITTDVNNRIEWDFHVACGILMKNDKNEIDTIVIDPSVSKTTISLENWLGSIQNTSNAKYTFTQDIFFSFNKVCLDPACNQTSNVINGYFYDYSGWSYNNMLMEKALALNTTAIKAFNKFIKNADEKVRKDLKAVIGNSATFKVVLEGEDGLPQSSKQRYLWTNYPNFMVFCMKTYSEELARWSR